MPLQSSIAPGATAGLVSSQSVPPSHVRPEALTANVARSPSRSIGANTHPSGVAGSQLSLVQSFVSSHRRGVTGPQPSDVHVPIVQTSPHTRSSG
jgi:hypothetical protein